jgi:uncharacterized damage-inducible protein DinB
MALIDGLLQELEHEAQTTRRVLERVPEAHLGWRPHPKSMSLGQLALHVATTPGGVAELAIPPSVPVPKFDRPSATSAAELMTALNESVAKARMLLEGMDDATLLGPWKLMDGEREVMALPRAALLRTIMLNHWYHHRGQLSVYLRELNVPVPSIYGPSADENPFETSRVPMAGTA